MHKYVCTVVCITCNACGLLGLRRGVVPVGEGGEVAIGQNRPVRARVVLRRFGARGRTATFRRPRKAGQSAHSGGPPRRS